MKRMWTVLVMSVILNPITIVKAASTANMSCSKEAMIGNTVTCDIKVNSEEKITGILGKLEYDSVLTYTEGVVGTDITEIINNSEGFSGVKLEGITKEETVERIKYIVSNKAEPGKTYKIKIKDVELTNGEKDIESADQEQEIKILSINEVLKSLKVNNHNIELKDGVTNYTIRLENEEKDANITAELTSDKYSFTSGKEPKTIKDLVVDENNKIELEIRNEEMALVKFSINIVRQEAVKGDTALNYNPQTGMVITLMIPFLVCLIIVFTIEYKKKKRKQL